MNAHHQIKNLATKHSLIKKMEALLKITAPEAKQVIDQDKLKHKVSQESIWKHFGLTAHQHSQVPTGENATMVKKYYLGNLNVYLGDGKSLFSSGCLDTGSFCFVRWYKKCLRQRMFFCCFRQKCVRAKGYAHRSYYFASRKRFF